MSFALALLLLQTQGSAYSKPLVAGQDLSRRRGDIDPTQVDVGQHPAGVGRDLSLPRPVRQAGKRVAPSTLSTEEQRQRAVLCDRRWFGRSGERARIEAAGDDPCDPDYGMRRATGVRRSVIR